MDLDFLEDLAQAQVPRQRDLLHREEQRGQRLVPDQVDRAPAALPDLRAAMRRNGFYTLQGKEGELRNAFQ